MVRPILLVLFALGCSTPVARGADPPFAPYAPDPEHLWNRLHRAAFVRTARDASQLGQDAVDPLLYADSKFLRRGDSQRQYLAVLKEFLAAAPDRHVSDPVKA